jgi:hypothetical protein
MMSWWDDVIKWAWNQPTIGQEAGIQPGSTAPATAVGNAVGGASGSAQAITAIWTNLRDGKMWRSLGWLLLGIILMLLGALWWIGPSASRASPAGVIRRGLT